ncbi:MAG: putative metal-binding motif-containing protein, partial [Planctomycetales bacterium]|nr:putative metal-binding motif-containing protein [Planctomycetales bacterium]
MKRIQFTPSCPSYVFLFVLLFALSVFAVPALATDADGDGYHSYATGGDDCNDGDASIHPGAAEIWYDDIDQDCDGANDFDQDMDGYVHIDFPGMAG